MARIGIIGSAGRMGMSLRDAVQEAGHTLGGGVDHGDDVGKLSGQIEVLVDFSAPDALESTLAAAVDAKVPVLVGTTGLEARHHAALDEAAQAVAVLQTGNTSLGVTLLAHLVREAAARLDSDWDVEILDLHHRRKVDAPSGTAMLLGEAAAAGRAVDLATVRADDRNGAREPGTIGFAAMRGGTIAGEHSVLFAGEEERLTLSHSAENRSIFARGAVRAAAWLTGQAPGRYTMNDVLGL